jgi:tetratricopeptide (TPR) repeat protein
MDSARWDLIQELFHEVVDLPAGERVGILRARCDGDEPLLQDVLAAIEEDERGSSILDRGLVHAAGRMFLDEAVTVKEIGPYRIVRLLGEGGMGSVFLAERPDLGSLAAIKVLRDAWLSPARRQRFASEQRTLAGLTHPAIARLYDAGTLSDGTPWIVMEYVDGVPLTEYCRSREPGLPERLQLFLSICDAVHYAHRHLIVHRDLKPSNILVTDVDNGDRSRDQRAVTPTVKLLDFGISKQLGDRGAAVDQTRTVGFMTPAYAAPEQLNGQTTGTHTDVYSLGVILYELVAGRLPFDLSARPPAEAARIVADEDPTPPSGRSRAGDVDVLCLTAMHKDPARRYQSVDALRRDVEHYLRGEPLEARPDAFAYRAGKFVRRHAAALTATAAAALVVMALVAFYTVRLSAARTAAESEAARTQRIQALMLNLFNGGDVAAGPAEDLRVVTLIDRGVQEADALTSEPRVQAEMYRTLGGIYQKLGNLPQAEKLLLAALERRKALAGAESPEAIESTMDLALLRLDQGQMEGAERLARDAIAMSERRLPPSDPLATRAMTALGWVLVERGEYAQAIDILDVSARRQEAAAPPTTDLATTLRQMSAAHFYAGNYDAADALTTRVLAMTRVLNGERHPLVAEDLINLGAAQHERGRYTEAERFYREALAITEPWYGKDHHQTASNLTMLGRSLVFQKRFDEAAALLQRALSIQERVYGAAHPRVASAVNDLGNIAVQNNDLTTAEASFRRMGDIYRVVYGGKHYLVATANSNLAGVYVARKEYRQAEMLYRDAVAMYTETLSPTHLNTGIARGKLGRALLRQNQYAEAETELLAGYEILTKQTSPSVSWVRFAREDLVALYDATGQPERAAPFRAELAAK